MLRTDDPEAVIASPDALKQLGFLTYHRKLIVDDRNPAFPVFKLRVGPITRDNVARHVVGLLGHGGF